MKRKKILYIDQFAISNMYNEGASQTYDTPSCFVIHSKKNAIVLKKHIYEPVGGIKKPPEN